VQFPVAIFQNRRPPEVDNAIKNFTDQANAIVIGAQRLALDAHQQTSTVMGNETISLSVSFSKLKQPMSSNSISRNVSIAKELIAKSEANPGFAELVANCQKVKSEVGI
jgi:hypothetical protein